MKKVKRWQIIANMPAAMIRRVKIEALRRGMSMSKLIEESLEKNVPSDVDIHVGRAKQKGK